MDVTDNSLRPVSATETGDESGFSVRTVFPVRNSDAAGVLSGVVAGSGATPAVEVETSVPPGSVFSDVGRWIHRSSDQGRDEDIGIFSTAAVVRTGVQTPRGLEVV